jgi:hypothetical protein
MTGWIIEELIGMKISKTDRNEKVEWQKDECEWNRIRYGIILIDVYKRLKIIYIKRIESDDNKEIKYRYKWLLFIIYGTIMNNTYHANLYKYLWLCNLHTFIKLSTYHTSIFLIH